MIQNMEHICIVFSNTRESFLQALKKLAQCDADFSGDNGEDYIWPSTKSAGFKTNVDYAINKIKNISDYQECAEEFVKIWMASDNYYKEYDIEVIQKDNEPFAISLAFVWTC